MTSLPSNWVSLLLLGTVLLAGVAAGATGLETRETSSTQISECTTISEPGRYVLADDLTHTGTVGSTACITVTANDVVLDGGATRFDGRGISNTSGIRVVGARNVTIQNVTLQDWHHGVHFVDSSSGRLRNVTVATSVYGVSVDRSRNLRVHDSSVRRSLVGVRLRNASRTTIGNTTFRRVHGPNVYRP